MQSMAPPAPARPVLAATHVRFPMLGSAGLGCPELSTQGMLCKAGKALCGQCGRVPGAMAVGYESEKKASFLGARSWLGEMESCPGVGWGVCGRSTGPGCPLHSEAETLMHG